MTAGVDTAREALIEMVAEADEALMEKFFEAGTLTDDELIAGLRAATAAGRSSRCCALGARQHRRAPAARCRPQLFAVARGSAVQGVDRSGADVEIRADEKAPSRRSCGKPSPIRLPAASRCSASCPAR
jgi:elongation factor G